MLHAASRRSHGLLRQSVQARFTGCIPHHRRHDLPASQRHHSHPDGDQPSGNPILSSLLLQSSEHLRMHWRSLGLSGDPFLSASDLQPRLQSFNARMLHRILGLIMQLCEDGASCVALDSSHSAVDLCELYDHPAITPPCWSADVITAAGPIDRLILPRRETGIR